MTDFSFLTESIYEESPISQIHKLSFSKEIEYGGAGDSQFDLPFDGKDYWDFEETLSKEHQEIFNELFNATGHKIGGYAEFTQCDPRENDERTRDEINLLQIDTDEEIMFGDSGIAHIFISPEDLKNKNFSKADFYWDCC